VESGRKKNEQGGKGFVQRGQWWNPVEKGSIQRVVESRRHTNGNGLGMLGMGERNHCPVTKPEEEGAKIKKKQVNDLTITRKRKISGPWLSGERGKPGRKRRPNHELLLKKVGATLHPYQNTIQRRERA